MNPCKLEIDHYFGIVYNKEGESIAMIQSDNAETLVEELEEFTCMTGDSYIILQTIYKCESVKIH